MVANGLIAARVDRPLSTAEVEAWRHRIEWDPSRRTVLIAARRKAQDVVLRALHSVTTPVRLVMAGAGENAFSHLVAKVPDRHAVVSFNFERDIRPLYELAELALLPTWDEGLSQALLEALALGCPVVASAVPGNAYVLRDGVNGRLLTSTRRRDGPRRLTSYWKTRTFGPGLPLPAAAPPGKIFLWTARFQGRSPSIATFLASPAAEAVFASHSSSRIRLPADVGGIARCLSEIARHYPRMNFSSRPVLPQIDHEAVEGGIDRLEVPSERLRTLGRITALVIPTARVE